MGVFKTCSCELETGNWELETRKSSGKGVDMRAILITVSLFILVLSGCRSSVIHNQTNMEPRPAVMSTIQQETARVQQPGPTLAPSIEEYKKTIAEELLESMTLEEKVGQLFMCAFRGNGMSEFNSVMMKTLDNYKPSGIVLFSENVVSKTQVSELIADLKNYSKVPMFIAVDEEGGRVSRLGRLYDEKIPAPGSVVSAQDALWRGLELGRRLNELGFNMNFAPVADIHTNPENTVIGDRAFSDNPETAAEYVSASVTGMISEGIIPVVKHFPGHGDTKEDSHYGIAVYEGDFKRLIGVEAIPFVAGIDAGAPVVMIGHINTPLITDDRLPATFSKYLITEILRGQLGFSGVIITDAMDMGAITKYYRPGEAAVAAIEAGVDIILMPADLDEAYNAVLEAVKSGRLTEERINESVMRILELKCEFLSI